ncbi:RNA 2',3'-cyclic phosphodiesterase [Calidifontibacter sp. DB0510]|uniref:RNA 2',3'-cyclic phosphodiesterase n=1 Tax=Metallococcus carri TaxID=1656884 RepID=A0A967B2P4_9MICO|nr:RNA 2',3'-cyclic phosphodiesterase [Metallococcus carri]NHN57203.1 RNA 2',3'-cyclic phosphodiesterase [Metallococcus carri]NOP37994.1 RNA 2',3'-cyclic phosphodiesterase [Calidifontibacter sp. DB2511S]
MVATQRMFVGVVPPREVVEDLSEFLQPRAGMPWIAPEQWHVTLAFCPAAPVHREDELIEALGRVALRHKAFDTSLGGAGTFPDVLSAVVLWLGIDGPLSPLASSVRGACNSVGATPDGKAFVPHLTLARLRRPMDARKWIQVLDTYRSPQWRVDRIELIASHLREGPKGRPRYETIAELPLG